MLDWYTESRRIFQVKSRDLVSGLDRFLQTATMDIASK